MSGTAAGRSATLVWRDRSGRETPFDSSVLNAASASLLVAGWPPAGACCRERPVGVLPRRPSSDSAGIGGTFLSPLWSPDGQRLIYESAGGLLSIAADGSDSNSRCAASVPGHFHPHGWVASDRIFWPFASRRTADIVRWPCHEARRDIATVVATPAGEGASWRVRYCPMDAGWRTCPTRRAPSRCGCDRYPGLGAPIRLSPNGGTGSWSGRETVGSWTT